jgi:hypothetical protein
MATYVNDLRLKEIGTGESSGTWGTETNTNLELIGDALGFGTEGITTNADTHTTTVADGSADAGRAMYIKYTGTLDSACTVTIGPNTINRMHFIENATTGSQNLVISQGTGSNVTIPAGDVKAVYLDGAGSGAAVADAFASLNVVDLKVQDDLTVTDDATIGGTLGVTGIVTLTDDLIIGDGKTIGSASDVDAMTIASNGQVTFSQTLIGTALDISGDIDVDGTTNLDVVDIDGAVDMASTLQVDGAITSSAGATITIADNSAALTVKSTDADSANGPIIDLIRDSASPADNDSLGMLRFKADNDAGEETIVANIKATVVDVSDGSEDGRLLLQTMIDGTSRNRIEITNTEVVVNQSSVDSDFRVESDNFTHAFFVQASDGNVGIGGASAPAFENGNGLEIRNPSGNGSHLKLTDNASGTGASQGFDLYMFNSQGYIENYENAPIIFRQNGSESARFDSGNFGIGTTSPDAQGGNQSTILNIEGSDNIVYLSGGSGGNAIDDGFAIEGVATGVSSGDKRTGSIMMFRENTSTSSLNSQMAFYTTGSGTHAERMRIDSGGRVMIAETSNSGYSATADDLIVGDNGSSTERGISLGSTAGATIRFNDGADAGLIEYAHSDNSMRLYTAGSERMRVDGSGNLLVGTTSNVSGNECTISGRGTGTSLITLSPGNNFAQAIVSNGDNLVFFGRGVSGSITQVGSITCDSSSTAYNTSSDGRLKDVTGSARGLEVINELNPVSYNWKEDGKADEGLIAQEVLDIVPNAVSQNEQDDYYQMDYSKLVTPLIKAIQEQQEQIDALQSEINELKNS